MANMTPVGSNPNSGTLVPNTSVQIEAAFREMPIEEQTSALLKGLILNTQRTTTLEENTAELNGRVTTLTAENDELRGTVDELTRRLNEANQHATETYESINRSRLSDLKKEVKDSYFPNKDSVWELRVLEVIIANDLATPLAEVERAIAHNKTVRKHTRVFIEKCKIPGVFSSSSTSRKNSLIKFTRRTLQANPLILWRDLHTCLIKASTTLGGLIQHCDHHEQLAADELFSNIDISVSELSQKCYASGFSGRDEKGYYHLSRDEWGGEHRDYSWDRNGGPTGDWN